LEIPPVLESLIRSEDGLDWPREPADGVIVLITVRDIRVQKTGVHALVAVTSAGQVWGHDTFNIGRSEDRGRLARRSATNFGTLLEAAYSRDDLAHDLDLLCLWIIREYESSRFRLETIDPNEVIAPNVFLLKPYVLLNAGTILFGEEGGGKSYLCQAMALCMANGLNHLWHIPQAIPVVYVNLERSRESMVAREAKLRDVLGIMGESGVQYMHARGRGLPSVLGSVRGWAKQHPEGLVILDSISRAGLGDLVSNETGNLFIDSMNSLDCAWLAVGHPPRDNKNHLYGSMMFSAGEDIGIQVLSERQDTTRGMALKVVKANDITFPPVAYLALEFAEDESGLTDIRIASREEFPELTASQGLSRVQQIKAYILDQADAQATTTEISAGIGMDKSNVSAALRSSAFLKLPKLGREQPYGLAHQGESP
jgi:hypothetical protein